MLWAQSNVRKKCCGQPTLLCSKETTTVVNLYHSITIKINYNYLWVALLVPIISYPSENLKQAFNVCLILTLQPNNSYSLTTMQQVVYLNALCGMVSFYIASSSRFAGCNMRCRHYIKGHDKSFKLSKVLIYSLKERGLINAVENIKRWKQKWKHEDGNLAFTAVGGKK